MSKVKDTSVYLSNIPGPKPFLFFGNYFHVLSGTKAILPKLLEFIAKYGDTILVHDGPLSHFLVTVDYEFTELLLTSSKFIDKAWQYEYVRGWLGEGLLTSTGSKWKAHRKAITPSFHFSILQGYIGVFNNVGDMLVKNLQKEVGKDSVEISKIISLYALDVICEAAMGVKINALEDESQYVKHIKTMCRIASERTISLTNTYSYPLTMNYYQEKLALKFIHGYIDNVIDQRIVKHQNEKNCIKKNKNNSDDKGVKESLAFLDLLLNSTINGRPLTRDELRDEVNTFMFEGHDTTASAIAFCLFMLATHPEVQDKVIKEQQHIFGNELKFATPNYQELRSMKYLDLVLKETLRLFPSVPYFGRELSKDLEFKGTLYPKGLAIMIFPFGFQRSPKYFSEPEKFMPERFENPTRKWPYSYTPFSAGPRNCIGQKFAMLELLSTISKIIRNFELMPATPKHELQLAPEAILISKTGICISIKNRL